MGENYVVSVWNYVFLGFEVQQHTRGFAKACRIACGLVEGRNIIEE
jgi:hypothetical protein